MNKKKQLKKLEKEKRQTYHVTSQLYKELKNNQLITFKKLRGCQGEYDYCEDEISIDYRREIIPTLVHELLHKWHPNKSESWISKKENQIMKRLTPNQAKRILQILIYVV